MRLHRLSGWRNWEEQGLMDDISILFKGGTEIGLRQFVPPEPDRNWQSIHMTFGQNRFQPANKRMIKYKVEQMNLKTAIPATKTEIPTQRKDSKGVGNSLTKNDQHVNCGSTVATPTEGRRCISSGQNDTCEQGIRQ